MINVFSGILNNDDNPAQVGVGQHIAAKNVRFYGGGNGLICENVRGNYHISNSSLPAGTNETIGAFYDQKNSRIFWFNYNSYGNNGIYVIDTQTDTITKVFLCNTDSATDILNFSLNYPVHSVAIVYRTSGDGDLLYWTDGNNRPRYLNIDTVASLAPFTEDMINAAKNAPLTPPSGLYQNDATVTTNSLKKKLFRFCYRWVYANGEKSTFSPISAEPLPIDDDNPTIQNDPTKNNNIEITMYSGGDDSVSIELAVQESLGNVWGNFKLVDVFQYADYNINPDSTFTFDFYNNIAYTEIPVEETDLYFSWLPNKANTLEALNGNVIIYGGITDGYDKLQRSDVDVELTCEETVVPDTYGFCYKWSALYRFGLVYFDDRGKTNGVVSFVGDPLDTTDFSIDTTDFGLSGQTTLIPRINASINHTPPTWATSYQWVRTQNAVTNSFIYYATNDYQVDGNYIYLGIQSLVEQKLKNTGFIPSYEFTPGDRVRVLAYYGITGSGVNIFEYNTQLDIEILGTETRVMTSPASDGLFLKCQKPSTFPSQPFILRMLIEIYTPSVTADYTKQVFYEFGQKYDIYTSGGSRYHRGQLQDQTALQAATFSFVEGDVYFRNRLFDSILTLIKFQSYIQDVNYSDYFSSAVNSNGRGWAIDENAANEYNSVLVRWGGKYQSGTNLNQLNIFRPSDFDEVDRSKGDIQRFKVRDRILRVFQDRGIGQYGIYARFIKNNEGNNELVTTNEIITTNNINYYAGIYGLCGYPTNLTTTQIADYFNDVVTGRAIRLSGDGMTDLGLLYKGQYTFAQYVTPYNQAQTRTNGSTAKVMGFFDFFENEFHTILQQSTTLSPRHYSFNEGRNAFCCDEYDYHPEWAIGAENYFYTWKDGVIYKHNNTTDYCNFFGVQYDATVTIVFNQNLLQKKSWNSLTEFASDTWDCPTIYTNVNTYGSQRQETNLVAAEFINYEGNPSASIKRDVNSPGGKINGGYMKGNWLVVKLRKQNAENLINLTSVTARFTDSPLNIT